MLSRLSRSNISNSCPPQPPFILFFFEGGGGGFEPLNSCVAIHEVADMAQGFSWYRCSCRGQDCRGNISFILLHIPNLLWFVCCLHEEYMCLVYYTAYDFLMCTIAVFHSYGQGIFMYGIVDFLGI